MWGKRPQSDTKIIYIYITYKIINNLHIHKQTNKFIYNYSNKTQTNQNQVFQNIIIKSRQQTNSITLLHKR